MDSSIYGDDIFYNGEKTAFLMRPVPPHKKPIYICPFFELKTIAINIPFGRKPDEAIFSFQSENRSGEFRINLEDLSDMQIVCKALAKQHFIISGGWSKLIYSMIIESIKLNIEHQNFSYQHDCLGWQEINGNSYFLLEKNELKDGSVSTCTRNFGRFTAGSAEEYDKMLEKYVYSSTELSLAYLIGFSGVIVARLSKVRSLPNLCIGLSGRSGTGKSTAAKLIASIWADPDNCNGGIMMNNDASDIGFAAQYAGFYGVPIIFDDTDAETDKDMSRLVYRLSKGVQRVVSTVSGDIDKSRMGMSGVCIFTSETPLLENTKGKSGLFPRFLDLADVRWTKNAEESDAIQYVCTQHFGHTGKVFGQYIENIEIEKLASGFDYYIEYVNSKLKEQDSFTARSIKKYAIILLTGKLVNKCFNININLDSILNLLLPFEVEQMSERDKATAAYKFLYDFFIDHMHNFSNGSPHSKIYTAPIVEPEVRVTNYGYYVIETPYYLHLYIPTTTCRKILESNGYPQLANYKKFWKEKGYTQCQGDRYDCSSTRKMLQRHFHFIYEHLALKPNPDEGALEDRNDSTQF